MNDLSKSSSTTAVGFLRKEKLESKYISNLFTIGIIRFFMAVIS